MKKLMTIAAALMAAPVAAQIAPENRTMMAPVAPPGYAVKQVAPDAFAVTPVPGLATATKVKVQNFADYDRDRNGVYNPMEFAQAMYFLATSDPVAGNPTLPAWDRYTHKGTAERMNPRDAITLLNVTADEFTAVDMNNDWRVSPAELAAVAMM